MKTQEIIDVVQAAEEGKIIQKSSDTKGWVDMDFRYEALIIFGGSGYKYRVKPDPREFYIYHDASGMRGCTPEKQHEMEFIGAIKVREVL